MAPRSSSFRTRALAALGLLALATSGLAFAQGAARRPPQPLPIAPVIRNSIGPVPPLDHTASERAEVAGRIYRAVLRGEARRYLSPPRAGEPPPDVPAVFDARLAERLGEWSLRWMEAARNAGGRAARFEAVRAHLERMRGLESGQSVQAALREAGRPDDGPLGVTRLGEFIEVARYFRLDAESLFQDLKSR
jgi:hypothetical protein